MNPNLFVPPEDWYPCAQLPAFPTANEWIDVPRPLSGSDMGRRWVKNFRYPVGMSPAGASAAIAWTCGSQMAAHKLNLAGTGGLTYRWVGTRPYVRAIESPHSGPPRYPEGFQYHWGTTKKNITRKQKQLLHQIDAMEICSTDQLLELLDEAVAFQIWVWQIHFEYMYWSLNVTQQFIDASGSMGLTADEIKLYLSHQPTRPREITKGLDELVQKALDSGVARNISSDPLSMNTLENSQVGRVWLAAFMDFLDEYGHRIDEGADPMYPTWREAPRRPLRYITRCISGQSDSPHGIPSNVIQKVNMESKLVSRAHRELLAKCEDANFIFWNEDHNPYIDLACAVPVRHVLLKIARQWWLDGLLPRVEDVFYLTIDEVRDALVSTNRLSDWPNAIKLRRDYFAEWSIRHSPEHLGTGTPGVDDPIISHVHGADAFSEVQVVSTTSHTTLTGIPAIPGTSQGIARIVRTLDDIENLRPEDIVVCETISPGWALMIRGVRGCVTARGGAMSHAASILREFGVPSVMGVSGVLEFIPDGVPLTINGDVGSVQIKTRVTEKGKEV